ncbi:multicopper oxidase family protein [Streptomyces megasporus]|uniref:multicopper oxidase family protein n=1 Tax=Streptomyces megasporus TaxID=44060 RepID=UPI0004E1DCA1|nr:multicopper oxidase [Streptomyces megasporus]
MDRRRFLRATSLTGGALLFPGLDTAPARATPGRGLPSVDHPLYLDPIADPDAIPRFVRELPRPARVDLSNGGSRTIAMAPARQDVLGCGPELRTPVWGFGQVGRAGAGRAPVTWPGPTVVARRHRPVRIHWANALPFGHLLPVDTTIHWAYTGTDHTLAGTGVPTVVHLHGAHTGAGDDGHPEAWYTLGGATGPRFVRARSCYDNDQEAATLWYHDHTMGLTRLNVYAGLAGFYLLRDDRELALLGRNRLPAGRYELELAIQDRMFHPDGRLAYPDAPADSPRWPGGPSIRPEFYGQVITVNGRAWPYLEVEPRQYRLRLLNASNSRFYRLSAGGGWPFPVTQIGSDNGFLHEPHRLDGPLVLSPGERADLVVDFRDHRGATFELTNDAPTPFPYGAPVAPPADRVLQFRVTRPYDRRVAEPRLPGAFRDAPYRVAGRPARTRRLLLLNGRDEFGRPRPRLGTVEHGALGWKDPITETPRLNTSEVWEVFNTTFETHPVHLHLAHFQVLERASFTATRDPRTGALSDIRIGRTRPPEVGESGPKDTVMVPPGSVTRVKAHFDRRGVYVWHCHILEHEEHDMMRNYEVV